HSFRTIIAKNPSTVSITDFEDIWAGGGDLVWPVAPETLEIVSSEANDNAIGTGAQVAIVETLDGSLNIQNIIVPLNGETPVVLTGTHFRVNALFVVAAGSSQSNEGDLTVRVSGGGNIRKVALAGIGSAQDCHFTVPAGVTAYSQQVITVLPVNEPANFRTQQKSALNPTTVEYVSADFPLYQNIAIFPTIAPFVSVSGTDFTAQASASNAGSEVNYVIESILIEDGF
ncbi:hypothetical protein KAR91_84650, partial [Candidatus Pacearchaeota archaeon]|nr:hypothetical protein [Candidatus Pacearchaeota archaeon]